MQSILISSASLAHQTSSIFLQAYCKGELVVIKHDRYAELVKTQQVQQHGTKAMTREDRRVRERCPVR